METAMKNISAILLIVLPLCSSAVSAQLSQPHIDVGIFAANGEDVGLERVATGPILSIVSPIKFGASWSLMADINYDQNTKIDDGDITQLNTTMLIARSFNWGRLGFGVHSTIMKFK